MEIASPNPIHLRLCLGEEEVVVWAKSAALEIDAIFLALGLPQHHVRAMSLESLLDGERVYGIYIAGSDVATYFDTAGLDGCSA
jgi:hypothetical protein